jgi:hypothetical protein
VSAGGTPAGWYPDPGAPSGLRWWDGQQWTEHTHAATPPAATPPAAAPPAAQPVVASDPGFGATQPGYGAQPGYGTQPGYGAQPGYGTQPEVGVQPGYGPTTPPPGSDEAWGPAGRAGGWGQAPAGGPPNATPWTGAGPGGGVRRGLWAGNRLSLIAGIVCVVYLLIAILTHFVLIGVAPLLLSVRALRARERLAPFALGASIVVIVVSIATFSH